MAKVNRIKYLQFLVFAIIFFVCNDAFAGATQAKLQGVYSWAKPIVNIILALCTLGAAAVAIYKTFFKHQEAGAVWVMFALGCIMWGLWITFANEIIVMLGGPSMTF